MNKIKSFQVDHRKLGVGIYVSRVDVDIVTYDLRFCKPNSGTVLDNVTMHTIEHMLATFVRNSDIKNEVLYFGPMGCQTGFYLLVRDVVPKEKVLETVKDILAKTIKHDGEVFGASEIECGNYKTLNLDCAKKACREYLEAIRDINDIITYDEVFLFYLNTVGVNFYEIHLSIIYNIGCYICRRIVALFYTYSRTCEHIRTYNNAYTFVYKGCKA